MDRLTNLGNRGEIWISDTDFTRKVGQKQAAYTYLMAYEKTGLTPDEIASLRAELDAVKRERDAAVARNSWTSIKETPPPKNVEILVSMAERVFRAEYAPHIQLPDYPWILTEHSRQRIYRKDWIPTHWRLLPEPVQEATNADQTAQD